MKNKFTALLLALLSICCVTVLPACRNPSTVIYQQTFYPQPSYELKVRYHALSTDTSTILKYTPIGGFSEYTATREHYTFIGFAYDNSVYTYDAELDDYVGTGSRLSRKIIAGEIIKPLTAVWKCNFPSYYFNLRGTCEYYSTAVGLEGFYLIAGIDKKTSLLESVEKGYEISFEDKEGEHFFDINANVYDFLMQGFEKDTLQNVDGDKVAFNGKFTVSVSAGGVSYEGRTYSFDLTKEEITFGTILEIVELQRGNLEGIRDILISFEYDIIT